MIVAVKNAHYHHGKSFQLWLSQLVIGPNIRTPAMDANLIDNIWLIGEVLVYPVV